MNGILIVNKEKDMTSRDIINKLNKIFNTKQIGHTGTLDPLATGVLVVCIGNSTKLVELLTSENKEYIAKIKLGIETDTLDITGNITKTMPYNVNEEQIQEVLKSFLGESTQEVPIYSAVKINGKKLYEYARNNEVVELPKRSINISNIELLSFDNDEIEFKCTVSKGTYIRSLIKDICYKLGTCGSMSYLNRTKQGIFNIENSYTLQEIEQGNYKILSNKEVLTNLEQISLSEEEYSKVKNGQIIPKRFNDDLAVFTYQDKLIAIYQTYSKDSSLSKPYKMFMQD